MFILCNAIELKIRLTSKIFRIGYTRPALVNGCVILFTLASATVLA